MAPSFIRTLRDRGLPAEPPAENPFDVARTQYDGLREYATKVMDIAREVDDENKNLRAENDSLRRENERLTEQLDKLAREQRTTSAFAESMRSRLKSIEEQISVALAESLLNAQQAQREPEMGRAIGHGEILRVNPIGGFLQNQQRNQNGAGI